MRCSSTATDSSTPETTTPPTKAALPTSTPDTTIMSHPPEQPATNAVAEPTSQQCHDAFPGDCELANTSSEYYAKIPPSRLWVVRTTTARAGIPTTRVGIPSQLRPQRDAGRSLSVPHAVAQPATSSAPGPASSTGAPRTGGPQQPCCQRPEQQSCNMCQLAGPRSHVGHDPPRPQQSSAPDRVEQCRE